MGEYKPGRLHDDSVMSFGKYRNKRLGEIPDKYWRWFLAQDWCDNYPELVEYANQVYPDVLEGEWED